MRRLSRSNGPLTLTLSPKGRGDNAKVTVTLTLGTKGSGNNAEGPSRGAEPFVARAARFQDRGGLTLLEVILALSIFVASMAVLSELVATGHRANLQSRLQTVAIIRAESQMNEVIANPSLLVSTSAMPFAEEYILNSTGQWVWSLVVASWDQNTNLLQLELTVQHLGSGGVADASYTLRRYVRDPQALAEAQAEAEAAATEGSLF